jgi:phosphonatase-like hydrolase
VISERKGDLFKPGEIDLVVFDLGGTVIKDTGAVPEAFTVALHNEGIDISDDLLRQFRGASKREVIRRLVEERSREAGPDMNARCERIFREFRELVSKGFTEGGLAVIAGAEDTFGWLRTGGIKVAINSGFDRAITSLVLDSLGWETAIDAAVCGDDVSMGRPAPYLIFRVMETTGATSVRRVVNVGDTVFDLQAGWNAGVRGNVGVLSGAHGREDLERAPYSHLLTSVADLPSLFE